MISVSESLVIERPLAEVFTTVADPFTQLKWDTNGLIEVKQLTEGPLQKGARYHGKAKGMGGTMEFDYEYIEYEPNRRFVHLSPLPFGEGRHIFEFEAAANGTHLTQTIQVKPKGIFKLLAPVLKMGLRQRLQQINAGLRQYLVAEE